MNATIFYESPELDKLKPCKVYSVPLRSITTEKIATTHLPQPQFFDSSSPISRKCILYGNHAVEFSHEVLFNAFLMVTLPHQKKISGIFYKAEPNGIAKPNGDFFCFCEPSQVIAEIDKTISFLKANAKLHPVKQATAIFYSILKIHPFEDGNGKAARLLCDLTLARHNQQPAFMSGFDRVKYKLAIDSADAGNYEPLIAFIQQHQSFSASRLV